MKRSALACIASLLATVAVAGPTDSAIVAAMKLPDARNYTWRTMVADDARSYEISGQTDKATDYSLVTMPMVSAVRRRVSRGSSSGDNLTTVLFKGDEKFVVQTDDGWKKPDDVSPSGARGDPRGRSPGGFGGTGGMRGRGSRGSGRGYPGDGAQGATAGYSNLQKTLSRPHEEIGIIVAGYTELKIEGEIISGPLTETAAMLLLVHPGQNEIEPVSASGTFRLWVRDGVLVKYETKLEGKLSVETSSGRREVTVHQTATTTITNVGTTKFDVPDDAKKKLGA